MKEKEKREFKRTLDSGEKNTSIFAFVYVQSIN